MSEQIMNELMPENKGDLKGPDFDPLSLFNAGRESVVNIVAQGSSGGGRTAYSVGSGFFISADQQNKQCEIATVNHAVIPNSRLQLDSIDVSLADGSKYKGKISKQDLAHDLAYLTIEGVENPEKVCKVLKLSDDALSEKESVLRISRMPLQDTYHEGKFVETIDRTSLDLIQLDGEDMTRQLLKFDLANRREQALGGAPILDASGEVVAIHAGGLSGEQTLAMPASDLKTHLENKK